MSKEKKVVEENLDKDNSETTIVEETIITTKTKNSNNIAIATIIVAVILAVLLLLNFVIGGFSNKSILNTDIKKVKKILNEKYLDINCVDSSCKYVVATSGDELKKETYTVFNTNGKKIAKYTVDHSKKNTTNTDVKKATDNYIITTETNKSKVNYTLRSTNGKSLYSTDKKMSVLNDNYITVESDNNEYIIIDKKGKTKYSKVTDFDTFDDGKYISLEVDGKHSVIDSEGNTLLSNYDISRAITDEENNLLYLVVKDVKNSTYYYYNTKKNKKVGDHFETYKISDKVGELIATKTENDKKVKYRVDQKGKQVKLSDTDSENITAIVNKVKESIDSEKYYAYSYGIKSVNQKNVFVDSKEDRSFGILNLSTKEYTKMYSYKAGRSYYYSSLAELNSDENSSYVEINCSLYNCDEAQTIIYNLDRNKEIYSSKGNDAVISGYSEYEDGYKVISYSRSSSNEELKGKYALLDKNNKQLLVESSSIVVVDKKLVMGNISNTYLILYSASQNKKLNDSNTSASKIKVGEKTMYKYTSNDKKTVICDENGKDVASVSTSGYLTYSNANIISVADSKVSIYNSDRNKTKTYKLKDNEKLNDEAGTIIAPYRGAVFINNSSDKVVKVLNSKAKVIRKIKNVEISKVKQNKEDGLSLIIVKKEAKKGDVYGLYIAK